MYNFAFDIKGHVGIHFPRAKAHILKNIKWCMWTAKPGHQNLLDKSDTRQLLFIHVVMNICMYCILLRICMHII